MSELSDEQVTEALEEISDAIQQATDGVAEVMQRHGLNPNVAVIAICHIRDDFIPVRSGERTSFPGTGKAAIQGVINHIGMSEIKRQ